MAVAQLRSWLRQYHYSQKLIVALDIVLFFVGCYLLSLYAAFPLAQARKVEGNLEPSFDACEQLPDLILGTALTVICVPFIGIGGIALRSRRVILGVRSECDLKTHETVSFLLSTLCIVPFSNQTTNIVLLFECHGQCCNCCARRNDNVLLGDGDKQLRHCCALL